MILGQLCFETMRLEYLSQIIQPVTIRGAQSCEIEGIAYDSRQVRPGFLFVALQGFSKDGKDFIGDAVERGAVAIVSENEDFFRRDVTCICVEDARRALAEIASAFYGKPSQRLQVIGITGTNGKSTTSFMARDILSAAGRTPGLIGTIRYEIGARSIPASRTTPESSDIQAMMDQMLHAGCGSVVMEVSSHGLDQKRVWGVDFDVGVFTNLTQDHLDYHKTMERYFDAKSQLFRGLGQLDKPATAVINIDDPWGLRLAGTNGFAASLVTYGLHPNAMVRASDIKTSLTSSTFRVDSPWGSADFAINLLGRFNISNALAATAVCGSLGVELSTIAKALGAMTNVPGRMESVGGSDFKVFIDYAHTPDALENALTTLREITPRRLLLVFGCGGNRDRSKRSQMGAVAAALADHTIVTSDNPRNEDPAEIMREIVAGFSEAGSFEVESDREAAIARSLSLAQEGDVVLIAGKGHENYQEFRNTVVPFDDRDVVRKHLKLVR